MKIFLDFGHGGSETGAVSNGLVEKNMTLVTGLECKKILEDHGIEVRTSRLDDRAVGLSERANMANSWGADYFVSIHYNAGGGDGVEVIHSIYGGKGEALAKTIVTAINKETGQNLRPKSTYSKKGSDGKDYFAVIRETTMDSVIVESGFIDSNDRVLFDTAQEQQKMGKAIAIGILNHLGIKYKENKNSESVEESLYYVETSYISPLIYANNILQFFQDRNIKFQLKSDEKGVFIQTMYMSLDQCKGIAYKFTVEFDIAAYVWKDIRTTYSDGSVVYSKRTLV